MGIPGLSAFWATWWSPGVAAWIAALYAKDERLKTLAGAVAAACIVAAPASAAFDALGVPGFRLNLSLLCRIVRIRLDNGHKGTEGVVVEYRGNLNGIGQLERQA